MKNFLKKLHIGSNQSEDSEGSTTSPSKVNNNRLSDGSPRWLNSVTNRNSPSPPSSSNVTRGDNRMEPSDSVGSSSLDAVRRDSGSSNSRDHDIEEEYQIQLALELSAKEDPEAVQIEAVKQISLGSCPPENTPAEVVACRYWNYNALSYDDKILDGFYDLYGILTESTSSRMPSLVDLQGTPVSDDISWEAILVNREADTKLLNLEQTALEMASSLRSHSVNFVTHSMVQKLANLVSDHMGGPVGDPDSILIAWRNLSQTLKANQRSMVLPIGSLTVGLARHRALLFKVLADSLGIPCRLVKGHQFTGSDDVAMNFVKIDGVREYIVDLMADPGTLIPSDAAGAHIDYEDSFPSTAPVSKDVVLASSSGGRTFKTHQKSLSSNAQGRPKPYSDGSKKPRDVKKEPALEISDRPNHPYAHARSPSWTEGVSSPAVRRMKVKDVSQYMIDAAKENPQLAQKLHDVLLESGVVAPPNLFTEMYTEELDVKSQTQEKEKKEGKFEGERISDRSTGNESSKSDATLDDVADCEIPWEDIALGSYGEVYRGDWHGTEVAVKKFLDQDITVILLRNSEVRGSLYRLIHRPNNQLDERRRLRMALDAARGMNYLHNCTPVIVHRDLKSPNLLVDKNWVVKVCDFGLSRMKHSTFLSSRSTAGTAEWMAPEVLRNEPSNEKCDVYSFGVILWELCTLRQPWGGMNPMQVVGAVGDPNSRPSFGEIMAALKPLQKPITGSQVPRPSRRPEKGQSSVNLEDSGDRRS
ncbi:hypothetical protein DH2020_013620 [Rehmannia glutinosa]|uniref:Protein kinase domain-containing protein n=1 Tax=Rehmannia glutinosa TaxID=99300 RepID=A0ABR0X2Y3_REHGL